MLARKALFERILEFRQRLQSERLGEVVVNLDLARRFHRFDGDSKGRILTCDCRRRVILREFDVEGFAFAGFETDKMLFEPGDELAAAQEQWHVLAGSALEWS